VLQTALRHLRAQVEKAVRFQTRDGAAVAGRLEAVQDRPLAFLVGGKAHEARAIATASIVDLWRAARGAGDEHALWFAIFDGDGALAEALLKRKPVELEARYRERLKRLAEEAAARAPKPAPAKKPEPAAREVVVHVAELPKGALYGELGLADDPGAAGGKLALIPQQGDTKDPLENDAQAVFKVQVQAGVPYRCWVRMRVGKAKGISPANLLYVQFTNAVDKAGKEILTLGTADYLTLRAPPKEGWLWLGRDLSDAKSVEPEIRFRTSGEVTVRIAAGLEGVGFDQFVLSPAKHLEKPPAEAVVPATRP
jgi:hypothetical protein